MKVLIVSHLFYPEVGAAPTRLLNMANALVEEGYELDVLTTMPNYPQGKILNEYKGQFSLCEKIGKLNVYRYWVFASNSMNIFHRLLSMVSFAVVLWCFALKRKLIKSYDCVIYQTPNLPNTYSAMLMLKKLYGKKAIINVSDVQPGGLIELGLLRRGAMQAKFLTWLQNRIYKMADGVIGQSEEILEQVMEQIGENHRYFLYRNLQRTSTVSAGLTPKHSPLKIIYAGLVGKTQDIYSIAKNINFEEMNAELHIYGGGSDASKLEDSIKNGETHGVSYHGILNKQQMDATLPQYDASIVPLRVAIRGAVPSKIFDLVKSQVPILFSGSVKSETAKIITSFGFGFVSPEANYEALVENVKKMSQLSDKDYVNIKKNELEASETVFNFDRQMEKLVTFLNYYAKK